MYFVFCLATITANIQYFWLFLNIQIKYCWKSLISFLKYNCTLHNIYFPLHYWQFFMTTSSRNMVYFSELLTVKYVNLNLWLNVNLSFTDLVLYEWKIRFKIGSLRCVKYNFEKKPNLTILTSAESQKFYFSTRIASIQPSSKITY